MQRLHSALQQTSKQYPNSVIDWEAELAEFGTFGTESPAPSQPHIDVDWEAELSEFGIFGEIPKKTPITTYITSVERQIARLTSNAEPSSGDWFKVQSTGEVTVALRFKGRILPLINGSNLMKLPSREVASAYLQATISTANEGHFDNAFEEVLNTKNPRESTGKWEPERERTPEEAIASRLSTIKTVNALIEKWVRVEGKDVRSMKQNVNKFIDDWNLNEVIEKWKVNPT